jgi:hypothetical protein
MTDIVKGMADLYEQGHHASNEEAMRAALLFFAERMEENGDAVTGCKLAAVSAYLSKGQDGRGMVEPVRLMKAVAAAIRAAAGGDK